MRRNISSISKRRSDVTHPFGINYKPFVKSPGYHKYLVLIPGSFGVEPGTVGRRVVQQKSAIAAVNKQAVRFIGAIMTYIKYRIATFVNCRSSGRMV
jgi:hypothetical protein